MEVMCFFYGDDVAHHVSQMFNPTISYGHIFHLNFAVLVHTLVLHKHPKYGQLPLPPLFQTRLPVLTIIRLFPFALTSSLCLTLDSFFMFLNWECLIRIVMRGLWVLL